MSGFTGTAIVSFLKQVIPIAILALFMAPYAAEAELLLQLHDDWSRNSVPETPRQTLKRPVVSCLNGIGDLFMRQRDVSLSMAYTPANDIIEPQGRLRIAQKQDCPSINGISLKLSMKF